MNIRNQICDQINMASNVDFLLIVLLSISVAHAWNYREQEKWPAEFCGNGIAQSPIDLDESNLIKIQQEPLSFQNWDQVHNSTVLNNGHTILVELPQTRPISVRGGGLPGTYNLVQFHFHWGSEHTVGGNRKAFESHFVTYNNKFSSLREALKYHNGIAVLGILYELSDKENRPLKTIVNQLGRCKQLKGSAQIRIRPIDFLPYDKTKFVRYDGSLTTPDCNDVVVWTIFSEFCHISKAQIAKFAAIRNQEGERISSNYRDVQPLNGRRVDEICTTYHCC
ncbi:hypothetical protein HHI36_009578 [Cryptolaemus montrouzieri]|uniref:carbonic anhydrase n=1 Tax=Cryptolaemus montrouzieri TaxID=559131 RepID=A0ABD2MG59_9CUCU